MKFVIKENHQIIKIGDVIEHRKLEGHIERFLIVKAWDDEGLWGYGLVNLSKSEQVQRIVSEYYELLEIFKDGDYRIVKAENLELIEY